MQDNREIREKLMNYLREYDQVYVLQSGIIKIEKLFRGLSENNAKRILLLTSERNIDNRQGYGMDIRDISDEEYHSIEKLYYMYEFSDHFHLLIYNEQYGSLDNYISNGILTEEEAFKSLFGR